MRNDYISYDADGFENQYNYTGGYVVSITPLNVTSDISAGNRFFVANDVSANGNLYVKNKLGIGNAPAAGILDISGSVIRNVVTASGYLGIGTTVPAVPLNLFNSFQRFNSNTLTNINQIQFSSSNGTTYTMQQIDNGGADYLRIGRNGYSDIVCLSNGNVGINYSNPSYLLDVNGNTRLGVTNGSAFKSVRVMTFTAGTTATSPYGNIAKTNISWGVTYSDATKIIPVISWSKALYSGSQTGDMFTIGLEAITTTGAVINLWRLDSPGTASGVTVTANVTIYEMV